MNRLPIDDSTRVLVLTGAGISAESGIQTFRGAGGHWKTKPFEELASPEGFATNPDQVWQFYSERRGNAAKAQVNAGHKALARLEEELGDRMLLVTQNVDGLHYRAGSQRVVEMHGNIFRTKCSSGLCRYSFTDLGEYGTTPECGKCGRHLRPDIVWFGEAIPAVTMRRISSFLEGVDGHPFIFVAIGTSGHVEPAASFVHMVSELGATTLLVNEEEAANVSAFDYYLKGKAGEILPRIL